MQETSGLGGTVEAIDLSSYEEIPHRPHTITGGEAAESVLKPSKLALHTTIQRIDEQRRRSGEAAKWEEELAEIQKNLQQGPQKGHKLVRSARQRTSEKDITASKSNDLGA